MSVRVCVHPVMMRDPASVSRYGSASSSISSGSVSPSPFISASAVAVISRRDAYASAPQTYQVAPMLMQDGKVTPPANRTCTLPEIPNSPSSRSVLSSDSPLLLQIRNVGEKRTEESSAGNSLHNTARNSMFPNFRALQRLALSAKTRKTSLNQNSRRNSSTYDDNGDLNQTPSGSSRSRTPILYIANDQPPNSHQDVRRSRSLVDAETPAGFSSLATLPGNRREDNHGQKSTSSADQMIQVYVADHAVPSKSHKKSAKKKKRKTRAKSRAHYTQRYPQGGKQAGKTPSDKGAIQDNSLGTLLRAMPVVVETKKIEVYSSRYSKCDTEGVKTYHTDKNLPSGNNPKHLYSPRKDTSQGIIANKLGTQGHDSGIIYASRVSPRIPGVGGFSGARGEKEDVSRLTRVYLSDKQSGNLRECGLILPCAPPGTPTPQMMQRYQYVPSMMDLRSQRAVRDRLSGIEQKAKKKQQQQREEAKKTEQQLQRDQTVAWKQRQRLEIYALNKIMTEFEGKNFQEFMKKIGGKTP